MNHPEIIEKAGAFCLVGVVEFSNVMFWRSLGDALLLQKKQCDVIMDFKEIAQADTSVLSLMMCWLRLSKSLGIKLLYSGVPEHVLRISELYGIKGFLPLA